MNTMKRIYNILFAILAFASVGCVDDLIDPNAPTTDGSNEVQFGLSLPGTETRTIYGIGGENSFPIFWVDGDKVKVYSPLCLKGRNNAEYQVTVPSGSSQNYADKLTATGAAGVQWGSESSATFYSIYPSQNVTISGVEGNVTATLNIPATQSLTHTLVDGVYYAADMSSVIMYAKTTAHKSDKAVNLTYIPYSTVLEFELIGDFSKNANASMFVQSLTLEAPTESNINLAGDFTFTFPSSPNSQPTIVAGSEKNIALRFTTQPELKSSATTLKAKMCLVPIVASLEGWTVSITVREGDNSTKTYKKVLSGSNTTLAPGKVHKIKLPTLAAEKEWEYMPGNWMPQLPKYRDIYLTELSIPGAWYAGHKTDDGYQNTTSIATLWDNGVRAYGVECRSYTPRKGVIGTGDLTNSSPTRICVSGNGSNQNGAYTHQWGQESKITYISKIISDIANEVNAETDANKKEFAVLVLNYADGGEGGHRVLDYKYFLSGLQNEINESGKADIIVDANTINSSTTIGQVAGKLIIKVNVDNRVNYDASSSKAIFSAVPLMNDLANKSSVYYSDLLSDNWKATENYSYTTTPAITSASYLWCFTSANRTHVDNNTLDDVISDIPTYSARKKMLEAMISHSSDITKNSQHNVWFYFNCGGTEATGVTGDTSGEDFAEEMNPWLLNIINRKINGYTDNSGIIYASDPSPLGIVMFNQCSNATYSGPAIVQAIVEMNNKFKLKRITDPIEEEELPGEDL